MSLRHKTRLIVTHRRPRCAYLPTRPRIQEVSDSELNFCFRKLSKKDTTTKVKALDELAALFALRSADELAAVLPAWVRRIIIFVLE
jgi:hypothetical protein